MHTQAVPETLVERSGDGRLTVISVMTFPTNAAGYFLAEEGKC